MSAFDPTRTLVTPFCCDARRLFDASWPSSQACVIGYLARISPIRFNAPSAATSGVILLRMTLAWAWPQICAAFASAQPGLKTEWYGTVFPSTPWVT